VPQKRLVREEISGEFFIGFHKSKVLGVDNSFV
jgi:hypothetical protein